LRPLHVGNLPAELAAHCAPHVFVQDLTVSAALEGNREKIYRAVVLDRHAASVLSLKEMRQMTDELIEAHRAAMPAGICSPATQDVQALRAAE
jgi:alpha-galactosidase